MTVPAVDDIAECDPSAPSADVDDDDAGDSPASSEPPVPDTAAAAAALLLLLLTVAARGPPRFKRWLRLLGSARGTNRCGCGWGWGWDDG